MEIQIIILNFVTYPIKLLKIFLRTIFFFFKKGDFGFATAIQSRAKLYKTVCGTDEWIAPEIALEDAYDHKVDVFSFGIGRSIFFFF